MTAAILRAVAMLLAGISTVLAVSPDVEARMEASTVRILNFPLNYKGLAGTGRGFIIGDGRHVVTNRHVVAGAERLVVVGKGLPEDGLQARVITTSENDLAILELQTDSGRRPASLAPS